MMIIDKNLEYPKYIITYKCLNCNEIIKMESTSHHGGGLMIDKFMQDDKDFARYIETRSFVYLHKCKDGKVGNCIEVSYEPADDSINKEDLYNV